MKKMNEKSARNDGEGTERKKGNKFNYTSGGMRKSIVVIPSSRFYLDTELRPSRWPVQAFSLSFVSKSRLLAQCTAPSSYSSPVPNHATPPLDS